MTLIRTVKARPRTRSGAPRWTSVMFATTAPPFPKPISAIAAIPTHTFGATAAQAVPTAMIAMKRTYAVPTSRSISGTAIEPPTIRPMPEPAQSRPKPRSPEWNDCLARKISATLTIPLANITIDQTTSTHISAREWRTTVKPSARSLQRPRPIERSLWSSRPGMNETRTAENAKVTALTT